MIEHGGLLRVFSFTRPMSTGFTPRHAQTARDLDFAMQCNAEIKNTMVFRTARLSSGQIVPRVIAVEGNSTHPTVRALKSNTLWPARIASSLKPYPSHISVCAAARAALAPVHYFSIPI